MAVSNPKAKFDPSKFKWLEFCPGKYHTGLIMTWEDLIREREKEEYNNREMFISRFAFNRDNTKFGPILSNLYFDFDCKENLKRAKDEAFDCAEFFVVRFGIPANKIKIRFTGGKGFSVEVPWQYFNLEPVEYLHLIWKDIAESIGRQRNWKTLDKGVYDRSRLWRLTNSRHASGYYKIPLSYDELRELKIPQIKKLATQPRSYAGPQGYISDMTLDLSPIFELEKLYDETESRVKKKVQKMEKALREKISEDIPAKFDESKIFYCVNELIKQGVNLDEGKFRREPTAFNIACSLHRLGASKEYVKARLIEFAENCNPPLPEDRYHELDHAIEMAWRYKYKMHCFTPCFADLCNKNKCWMFQEIEAQRESYPDHVLEEAQKVINSPDRVLYVEKALGDVVGEEKKKVFLFFLQLIGESAELAGKTSSGKNKTMDAIMDCFPRHKWFKITGASAKAVRYLGDEVETLYLAERKAARDKVGEESLAEYDLKLAISEGKLCLIVVEKTKAGKFRTAKIETALRNVMMTSTEVKISPELQNRIWEAATDESPEQNKAVRDRTLEEFEKFEEDRIKLEHEKQVLRAANEVILKETPSKFIIPYATLLKELLNPDKTRVRRDTKKLLKAIQAFAKFNYKDRTIYESPRKKERHIVCLPQDFFYAWNYGQMWIVGTFTGKTKRFWDAANAATEIIQARKKLDANTLGYIMNIGYTAARNWLNRLADEGFLIKEAAKTGKRGRTTHRYKLSGGAGVTKVKIEFADLWTRTKKWYEKNGLIKEYSHIEKGLSEDWKSKILNTEIPCAKIPKISDLPDASIVEEKEDDQTILIEESI